MRVAIVTFNCGSSRLPQGLVEEWCLAAPHAAASESPDLVVVGLQEYAPYVEALLLSGVDTTYKRAARAALVEGLNAVYSAAHYEVVGEQYLGTTAMLVLAHSRPRSLEWGTLALGTGGAGVKGAIACRLTQHSNQACVFVCAHLAAHAGLVQRRNAEYRDVMENLEIGGRGAHVDDADALFFFGDLNYRVDATAEPSKLPLNGSLCTQEQIKQLVARDELTRERGSGRAFSGFAEPAIEYAPTFKYVPHAQCQLAANRMPSYCDRVMYRSSSSHHVTITPLAYFSVPKVTCSDHKPVSLICNVTHAESQQKTESGSASEVSRPTLAAAQRRLQAAVMDRMIGLGFYLTTRPSGVAILTAGMGLAGYWYCK